MLHILNNNILTSTQIKGAEKDITYIKDKEFIKNLIDLDFFISYFNDNVKWLNNIKKIEDGSPVDKYLKKSIYQIIIIYIKLNIIIF